MEIFIETIKTMNDPKTIFLLCGLFIFTDVLTGYVKAFKNKKVNSSISRDGYIKKIGWTIAILLGFLVEALTGINLFLIGSAIVCISTEGISIYENLGEIGVNLPFKRNFEKLDDNDSREEE